jgi:hypothetical protein
MARAETRARHFRRYRSMASARRSRRRGRVQRRAGGEHASDERHGRWIEPRDCVQ